MPQSEGSLHGCGASANNVPLYLMPVAATLGTVILIVSVRVLYQIYRNLTYNPNTATAKEKLNAPRSLKSKSFVGSSIALILCVILYGISVARVENAMADAKIFDPYEILNLSHGADNTADIKRAYRALSLQHHPDKGGGAKKFHDVNLAYRALTDETSRHEWKQYGHPDGPQHVTLSFALPHWLLHPEGMTAAVLIVLYIGMFVGLIKFIMTWSRKTEENVARSMMQNSVSQSDITFVEQHIKDEMSHLDILLLLAVTPELMQSTYTVLKRQEAQREEKIAALKSDKQLGKVSSGSAKKEFDIGGDGWADDEDEEDDDAKAALVAAKEHEVARKLAARQLAASTGKLAKEDVRDIMMEGVDDGVIGQFWVEEILKNSGEWPPKTLKVVRMALGKSDVEDDPLRDPAVERNVLMTVARLHSQLLNTHPDLINAAPMGLVDAHYFKYSMEYRQRNGLLLEAALRSAISRKSFVLANTIIEAATMFKIGTSSATDESNLNWFKGVIERQYGCEDGFPRLDVQEKRVETAGEQEIATDDTCALQMTIERCHALRFFEKKMELCKLQGIDPRIALQTYHEGWWILVRSMKVGSLDNDEGGDVAKEHENEDDEDGEPKLLMAWPFIVRMIAQKVGKIRVQFKAPSKPGKYKFLIDIKSQDFLGADQSFEIETDILDHSLLTRNEDVLPDECANSAETGANDCDEEVDPESKVENKKEK